MGEKKTNGNGSAHRTSTEKIDDDIDNEIVFEFGGSAGVVALMVAFPLMMLYFWACLTYNKGAMITSATPEQILTYISAAYPTVYAFKLYIGFCFMQIVLAATMPGPVVLGMAVPSEGNKKLPYLVSTNNTYYQLVNLV
jgi:delta24(24(1))-sterol reductase